MEDRIHGQACSERSLRWSFSGGSVGMLINCATVSNHAQAIDLILPLEKRFPFSSGNAVTLEWQGSEVRAYQNQYIVETNHFDSFEKLAHAKGFTDVTSLGGEGYYSFNSSNTCR